MVIKDSKRSSPWLMRLQVVAGLSHKLALEAILRCHIQRAIWHAQCFEKQIKFETLSLCV